MEANIINPEYVHTAGAGSAGGVQRMTLKCLSAYALVGELSAIKCNHPVQSFLHLWILNFELNIQALIRL